MAELHFRAMYFVLLALVLIIVTVLAFRNNIKLSIPLHVMPSIMKPYDCVNFKEYISSSRESTWLHATMPSGVDVCAQAATLSHERDCDGGFMACIKGNHLIPCDTRCLSKFVFENSCTNETFTEFIEPLVSVLRHPGLCRDTNVVVDKSYMMIEFSNRPLTNIFIFDFGASLYDEGGGGASQRWLVELYNASGFPLEYYAWEASVHAPDRVWSKIPFSLIGSFHWYNVPVRPFSRTVGDGLEIMRSKCVKDDYVVLKIDIDHLQTETQLIKQLLADPGLYHMVDELFFENHVNFLPMRNWWGEQSGTYSESISLFHRLRKLGIKAHSWV